MATYDVIVLGLGAMGSAATYHLTKAGKRVLALEQFDLNHALGSSYGESRIIRYAYNNLAYIEMAKQVYPLWRDVEADTGKSLMVITGGFDWGKPDDPHLADTIRSLDASGIAYERLTPAEVTERLPQFALKEDEIGIYQRDAGYLKASECVLAHALRAQELGATLLTNTPVTGIQIHPDSVTVQAGGVSYSAGGLVITAGPWAGKVLNGIGLTLPLQPTREILGFFQTERPEWFGPERCPSWIYHGSKIFYGIANPDGVSGFKAAVHGRHEPTDPSTINRVTEAEYVDELYRFLRVYIPKGAGPLIKTYVCMYTMTPDEDFIIDQHPQYSHVSIGAGFSGHGFKFSTLIGKMLGDLATEGKSAYSQELFSLQRFIRA